ncbi:hypothetical protein ACFSHT_11660 [Paraburkholderia silviterrae]|uniref:PEGA domain-containing protein n=1 Tax=Paraburkholderia silviterrae TaxID=2528715 RepID=A0A4R5MEP0_9BURK|nr:hypothetical protein [Paraburkholderia silviterrae]TDG25586.1 hypothetical protein EYW47_07145 [Paraburkholderia silviterrae]
MPSRVFKVRLGSAALTAALVAAAALALTLALGGCAEERAPPVPFKPVPAERIVKPGYTQAGEGLVAVDVRRERTSNVIVKFRDAPVYIDGEQVTDLMNGEHVTFYLSPGVHRIGVTTQFDPVVELRFLVDPRYTNRASVTFDKDHRITLRRVAQ